MRGNVGIGALSRKAPVVLSRCRACSCLGLALEAGNRAAKNLDLGVIGDLEDHEASLFVERRDPAEDAAAGDDGVALLELREHLLGLLLLLAHGRDEKEVEDDEDE